ncbi:MAG TPA: LuxR C-terminal-related transcriptional regulator [Sphingomicrobium sp.]|nr:LuxR C-terminal-related transcriptional regulator [Sphingomicrobium sp.]
MSCRGHDALFETLGLSPIAMVISDPYLPDNPLAAVNPAFLAMTGYSEAEVVGRNCRFLAGDGTDALDSARLRQAIGAGEPVLTEIVNYRRDGTAFRNGVMITPLVDEAGEIAWFLGSQVDLGPVDHTLVDRRSSATARVRTLSPRQREILALVAGGLLNKQIAFRLGISEKTVKMHRALMLDRLGASTSAEAIRLAVEAGL